MGTYAKVIADSVSPEGVRLTTMEVCLHRWVLAELNTHRVFARSSASSRAIPVEKMLARFDEETAYPVAWTSEQPGMQGGVELEGIPLVEAKSLFRQVQTATSHLIEAYLRDHPEKSTRLHKSRINRLMEWGQYHTVVITSTAWENFFGLRCHELAEPEIRLAADMMKAAYDASTPTPIGYGKWHLPYITEEDREYVRTAPQFSDLDYWEVLVKSSVACCARASYLTQGKARDFEADFSLYTRLTTVWPAHAAPLEHVATPVDDNEHSVIIEGVDFNYQKYKKELRLPRYGNFLGWQQHRIQVEAALDYQSFV